MAKNINNILLVVSVAFLISIIMTWPFAANLTSYYSDQGDYSLAGSVLWYNAQSIANGKIFNQKKYYQGYQFYPQPYSFAFQNNSLAPVLFFGPFYWMTNNLPFSVNAYALLTMVLSFLSAYYACWYFTKNPFAAAVGAVIFTFNPQTMVRFPQHLDVLGKYLLPLVFLFSYKLFEKPTWKISLAFFTVFTLNALTVNYYFLFSLVLVPLAGLTVFIPRVIKKDWKYVFKLLKVSLLGLIFLPILLYFDMPYLNFSQKEGAMRSLGETIFFSARITDWFAASPDNMLYGGWVKSIDRFREPKDDRGLLNYEEHTLFVGIVAMVLFILGWRAWRREKSSRGYLYVFLFIPFVLMLGPYFNGHESGIPLPFYAMYEWVPFMKGIRSPVRFEFIMLVPFAILASYGADNLFAKFKKKHFLACLILALVALEYVTVKDFSLRSATLSSMNTLGKDKLSFLKDQVVFHVPVYSTQDADNFGNNSAYMNWATQTGEKIINGNTSYLPPDQLGLLESVKTLDDQALLKLSLLGVNYVVIHPKLLDAKSGIVASYVQAHKSDVVLANQEMVIFRVPQVEVKVCVFPNDLTMSLTRTVDENENMAWAMVVKNEKQCYLVNKLDDRYREVQVTIEGVKKTAHIRLPVILEPGQGILVSEPTRDLRIN